MPGAVLVSAEKRWGLELLRERIVEALASASFNAEAQRAQSLL
jgi:50S ribosomal subunit-associated GTPase HflX